jgi:hypothetical protein
MAGVAAQATSRGSSLIAIIADEVPPPPDLSLPLTSVFPDSLWNSEVPG